MKKIKYLPLVLCIIIILSSGFSFAMEVSEDSQKLDSLTQKDQIGIQAYEERVVSRVSERWAYNGVKLGETTSYINIQFHNGYSVSTNVEENFYLTYWERITLPHTKFDGHRIVIV